jgi:hypothetical protein
MTNEKPHDNREHERRNRLKRVVASAAGLVALSGIGLYVSRPSLPEKNQVVNVAELPQNNQKANVEVTLKNGEGISNAIFDLAVAEGLNAYKGNVINAINHDSHEIASAVSQAPGGEVEAGTKIDLRTDHPIIPKDLEIATRQDPNISIQQLDS